MLGRETLGSRMERWQKWGLPSRIQGKQDLSIIPRVGLMDKARYLKDYFTLNPMFKKTKSHCQLWWWWFVLQMVAQSKWL